MTNPLLSDAGRRLAGLVLLASSLGFTSVLVFARSVLGLFR